MKLAWKLLKTDWRSGELALLFAALFLSVVVITGLTLFIERLQIMLAGESSQFLAADRVLEMPRPVKAQWLEYGEKQGLTIARHLTFQSMLYANDEPELVSVKAADAAYPLRGELSYRASLDGPVEHTLTGPEPGEIWLEARLFQKLKLSLGDEVFIGDAPLIIKAVLVAEPDRGAGFMTMGPRVLMAWEDIEKTAVVDEGSRLSYSYLFTGNDRVIAAYEKWLLPQLSDSDKWLDIENTQPTVALALTRAKNFFLLASSIVVILASLAIAMSSIRFSQRHIKQVAVLKTLGAPSAVIQRLYLYMLLLVMLVTVTLAWFCAWLLQEIILYQVAQSLKVEIPPVTTWPFLLGLLTAAVSLAAFSLPPLWQLKNIPAVRIFHLDNASTGNLSVYSLLIALAGLLAVLIAYTQQLLFAALLLASVVLLCVLVALPAAWFLQRLRTVKIQASGWLTLAVSNLKRRLKTNAIHTAVFAISLMLLLVLAGVKNNLFVQWQQQLPAQTPNYFLVNIQQSEWVAVKQWLENNRIKSEVLYPMVRGRLVEINQTPVRQLVSKEELGRAGADRELNLSWAEQLPPDNVLAEGEWWNSNNEKDGVSVEQKLAEKLHIKMGDTLTFQLADERFSARVSSIRQLEWDKMRPNFYMLFTQQQLEHFPRTWMTSFWLPDEQHQLATQLLKAFPTVILIDIDVLIKQIHAIVSHVSLALEVILVFVMLGSLLVMAATVQNSLDERLRENTVIRALGGTRRLIAGSLFAEFALIGLVAGLLATLGAEVVLLLLQQQLFRMDVQLHPGLWWVAPVTGLLMVGLAGFFSARKVLQVAPMQLLREM